eukprot:3308607-Ditylum_brightwellii.AAC.1
MKNYPHPDEDKNDEKEKERTDQEWDREYGTRSRDGLRLRRIRVNIPSKFREYGNVLFQVGSNINAYTAAKTSLHRQNIKGKQMIKNDSVNHSILTQYHISKGLKAFGDEGKNKVLNGLKQLHDRMVLDPKDPEKLTHEEKNRSLQYLMFLTKKRCGRIKGRGCADRNKQRSHIPKDDASAPTVAIESLMLSCLIDAKEGRDVAIIDIPGALMQADIDEIVHMKFEGTMAELLTKLEPKMYRKYLQDEKGKPLIYVQLKKALYGTLRAALLFWQNLSATLQEW